VAMATELYATRRGDNGRGSSNPRGVQLVAGALSANEPFEVSPLRWAMWGM
jgi:hypothetical protein